MEVRCFRNSWTFLLLFVFCKSQAIAQDGTVGEIKGTIKLDSTWSPKIYLSYIPTFSDVHTMASEMIIADAAIDSLGKFRISLDFLPAEQKVYRLHITKKDDSKTSLIIGGSNENYLLLMANRNSKIELRTTAAHPPFKNTVFASDSENYDFQQITNLVFKNNRIASKSEAAKRKFMEERLREELMNIADSSSHPIVSLYAVYQNDFEADHGSHEKFYTAYLQKWSKIENSYFDDFRKRLPYKTPKHNTLQNIFIMLILVGIGFLIGRYTSLKKNRLKKLSVQERKIYVLLQQGATNKEISEEFNIGISTAKSHVSSILTKLKVKSRKEIMK